MLTLTIQSFGCRANQAEGFEWAEACQALGFKLEKSFLKSELIIVNSCALTSEAEREVRKFLRRVARLKPQAKIIFTGCAVPLWLEELKKNHQIILIVPNDHKELLFSFFKEKFKEEIDQWPKEIREPNWKSFRSRALIKIQDGCSQDCTFCLIPRLRGPSRSRPLQEIIDRIKQLIDQGYKEIVLAGIHLTSYGEEKDSNYSLLKLLEEATKLENLGRLRLSSLDPRAVEDDLINFIGGHEKISQHFHFSFQHASEKILHRMGRKGQAEEYGRILQRLREKSPYASLGADFIVGFPGETEEDFLFLENFVASSPLTYLHVFPYSRRPGTPAAQWPQIETSLKKARAERLRSLGQRKNLKFRESLRSLVFDGIAITQEKEGETEVLTHNYIKVKVREKLRAGEAVRVRIEEVKPDETRGSVVAPWVI
ncbi:MAG: tRNA (N(6)-L-threonylcarbamoyladenosine(37)-C(2))-methylthiotransferase MtaB [Candidatus Aminicenantes bacterium]|nr:tRNA (N(6)-L-threonylcarbamoyladenosine(37)-C(2))-methylthiotransferase MtaB [Candidatus Aminicenantes bacterium]